MSFILCRHWYVYNKQDMSIICIMNIFWYLFACWKQMMDSYEKRPNDINKYICLRSKMNDDENG